MNDFVRVDFGKPIPLFPLPDTVLLPHAVLPFQIFEPRYLKMVNHCLDSAGQIAMACFESDSWSESSGDLPPLRPAVCIGQIVQHEKIMDGRHNILLHGVCRARIEQIYEPDEDRPFLIARLSPIDTQDEEFELLDDIRAELRTLIRNPRLRRMRAAKSVSEWFDREDVSTLALLELIGAVLLHDSELKYKLLSEPSPEARAGIIKGELLHLDRLVNLAEKQDSKSWPKGMSWN